MLAAAQQFIRDHRRTRVLAMTAAACEKFLRAHYNENFYDFDRNGERFALSVFARWSEGRPVTIWDVGAHEGQWAKTAHSVVPKAQIVSFEIMPAVFQKLATTALGEGWLRAENLGLSDHEGQVNVHWNRVHDNASAIVPRLRHRLFAGEVEIVRCEVTTGEAFRAANGLAVPDLLKVDVEGHEPAVLRGCAPMLSEPDAPAMIQFEYGETYIPSGSTLYEVYELLGDHGYRIGRLYPDYVGFIDYSTREDHFRMGNYVAVRDQQLAALLS
jgi:FkbM family methyltransferase